MKKNPIIKQALAVLALTTMLATNGPAQLLFTQYYEGTSNNKWVELKNLGNTAIDLSNYSLSLYTNGNAENWKTGSTTGALTYAMTGNLAAGAVYLVANPSATLPSYAVANATNGTAINFNGNDSIVLWNDSLAFSTNQIVDALSFTNAGNQGADNSFVRLTTGAGYNLTAGSSITNFTSVWGLAGGAANNAASLNAVANATNTSNEYLGYATVPEPSVFVLMGVALTGFIVFVRRRKTEVAC